MKRPKIRLGSALLASALMINLLPVPALAVGEGPVRTPARPQSVCGTAPKTDSDAVHPQGEVVEIRTADDLAAAIAGQEAG